MTLQIHDISLGVSFHGLIVHMIANYITAKYMYVGQRAERALRRGRGLINSSRAIHLFITAQGPVPRP